MSYEQKCGCKGIRSCLLCEIESGVPVKSCPSDEFQAKSTYTYCPYCNLFWPEDEEDDTNPLYLGNIKLFLDFISEDEEECVISAIDKIPWMPSQSGRRKQDFGPKVNFKKKKVRIGEFKGFPMFTERILQKFQNLPEISDFQPVELCHLEYTPERGSSIDPHVDDFWLWGERLVTINLGSPTVLTLAPCADGLCECNEELKNISRLCTFVAGSCNHKLNNVSLAESSLKPTNINVTSDGSDSNCENTFFKYTEGSHCQNELGRTIMQNCVITDAIASEHCLQSDVSPNHLTGCCKVIERRIGTMCDLLRSDYKVCKTEVSIVLPPRSLLVLAGCARYNWSHEIKRQDVMSRRLAMTFRELTAEFLDGGRESLIGKELLSIASNFCDL